METRAYTVILRHPSGIVHIQTTGSTERAAIDKVLGWEGAPESAILAVTDHGPLAGVSDNAGRD